MQVKVFSLLSALIVAAAHAQLVCYQCDDCDNNKAVVQPCGMAYTPIPTTIWPTQPPWLYPTNNPWDPILTPPALVPPWGPCNPQYPPNNPWDPILTPPTLPPWNGGYPTPYPPNYPCNPVQVPPTQPPCWNCPTQPPCWNTPTQPPCWNVPTQPPCSNCPTCYPPTNPCNPWWPANKMAGPLEITMESSENSMEPADKSIISSENSVQPSDGGQFVCVMSRTTKDNREVVHRGCARQARNIKDTCNSETEGQPVSCTVCSTPLCNTSK